MKRGVGNALKFLRGGDSEWRGGLYAVRAFVIQTAKRLVMFLIVTFFIMVKSHAKGGVGCMHNQGMSNGWVARGLYD